MNKSLVTASLLFFFIFLNNGCGYKLGAPVSHQKEIFINIRNDSVGLQLGPKLDRELRKTILKNFPLWKVGSVDDADLKLIVILKDFQDQTESFDPKDAMLGKGFSFRVFADLTLLDKDGNRIFEDEIVSYSSITRQDRSRLPDAKPALQALAESMASSITSSMLNKYW